MNKSFFIAWALILFHLLVVGTSFAAKITHLNVSPSSLSLPDQDPDLFPVVSTSVDLSVTFSIRQLEQNDVWLLQIYANDDLVSGGNSISIGNVRWTAVWGGGSPGSFQNGTLSRGIYLPVGTGAGDPKKADVVCYLRFYLNNSWYYATGNYLSLITLQLSAPGDVASQVFTLSLGLSGRAKLQLGVLAMNFPDADPDHVPSIPSTVNPVFVSSASRTGSSLTTALNCLANGDLRSGSATIPINNIQWQSTGSGYVGGTMSTASSQSAGYWTGSGVRTGSFSYFLTNAWNYSTGNYSATVTYILTAP